MKSSRALFIAVIAIFFLVLFLTYEGVFSSYLLIAVIFVLYIIVSLFNRRKFKRQEGAAKASKASS